jgi:hypothetical protein
MRNVCRISRVNQYVDAKYKTKYGSEIDKRTVLWTTASYTEFTCLLYSQYCNALQGSDFIKTF